MSRYHRQQMLPARSFSLFRPRNSAKLGSASPNCARAVDSATRSLHLQLPCFCLLRLLWSGSQVLLEGAGLVLEQARSAASDRDSKGSPPRRHSTSHQLRPRFPGAPSAPCPPGSEQGYLGFKLVQRGEFTGFEGTGAVDLVEVVGCEDQPQHRTLERPRVKPAPRPGHRGRARAHQENGSVEVAGAPSGGRAHPACLRRSTGPRSDALTRMSPPSCSHRSNLQLLITSIQMSAICHRAVSAHPSLVFW